MEGQAGGSGNEKRVHVRYLPSIALWAFALFLIYWFFDAFRIVFLGFLAAASLASALRPAVRKAPGPIGLRAVIIGILPPILFLGFLIAAVLLLAPPIKRELSNLPQMEQQANIFLLNVSNTLGLAEPLHVRDLLPVLFNMLTGEGASNLFSTTTNTVSMVLIALAFIFIGSIYILIDPPIRWLPEALKIFPEESRVPVRTAFKELGPKLRWWMIGTIVGSISIGLASGIGYALVGLNFAVPLALIAGLGEAIPTIGPLLTYLIALVFAATQGWGTVIGVTIVYVVVQTIESYLLMPLIMKKAVEMPPLITLFTIVFWGTVFGFAGLLLAIPLNLAVWVFVKNIAMDQGESQVEKT